MSHSTGPVTEKITSLIHSVSSSMDKQPESEEKQPVQSPTPPTVPEQSASEYDLSKPYRVVVREGNQGGAEKLCIENFSIDSSDLSLGDDELLIDVAASGINFIDTYHRSGLYPNTLRLGKEGAGTVLRIGAKVSNYAVGDSVCWFSIQGSYATHVVTRADNMGLMKLPQSVESLDVGAALGIQALTAHFLCRSLYPVGNQTSVLIHAGAGGTGGLLVQMCKLLGAPMVICTVGSDEKKRRALEYGADHVVMYKQESFAERVLDITKQMGVNVVFDGVGLSTHKGSLKCAAVRGMCVFFGNASGAVPPIDPLALTKNGSLFITRPTLSHYIRNAQELQFRYGELFEWMEQGKLKIPIGHRFNLRDVFSAHKALESRGTIGKIVLKKDYQSGYDDGSEQIKDKEEDAQETTETAAAEPAKEKETTPSKM